jgi:NADPH:quinone reductase-like Zn-dependent oxidoreductase
MKVVGVTGPDFMPRPFDVDEPTAAPNEVVVKVMAASVNSSDRAAIHGRYAGSMGQRLPMALGRDFVGRVAAVGADVDYIGVGLCVAGTLAPRAPGQPGTFADLVAVPVGWLTPVPDGIDLAHVAAVGLAGVTALAAISALGATRLGNLVVQGPISEAGGFAVQLAKAHGAIVAVVTPPAQVELARRLGADLVIPQDTDATRSIQVLRNFFGGSADTAIHVAGDPSVSAAVLRSGGRVTSVTDTDTVTDTGTHAFGSGADYVPTVVAPSGHELADLLFKLAAHRLYSHVGRALSFDQVGDAVNPAGHGGSGRTVLIR